MDVSSLYRVISVAPVTPRAVPVATADSVDTMLPQATQSVAPVAPGEAVGSTGAETHGNGGQGGGAAHPGGTGEKVVSGFDRDTSTGAMVFKAVDSSSGTVIVQFPDEQLLKLRSYLAEMARREGASKQSQPGSHLEKTM